MSPLYLSSRDQVFNRARLFEALFHRSPVNLCIAGVGRSAKDCAMTPGHVILIGRPIGRNGGFQTAPRSFCTSGSVTLSR